VFAYRASRGDVEVAFTDRHGGVSDGPWSSLNLGTGTGDDPGRVQANVDALATALGVGPERIVRMTQVHGRDVRVVCDRGDDAVADALVTTTPDLTLLVRAADCLPVLLADPGLGAVAAVHAGRQGLAGGVVPAAVSVLRAHGATEITGWLGPRICGACYEVPEQLRNQVAERVPQAWSTTSWGTPALDIAAGVTAQLVDSGVAVVDMAREAPACTYENSDLFSYRRQGKRSGRLGGLIRFRA
jgi:YfiH family protein